MIITIVDERPGAGRSGIAPRLARSRAHAGRNVLLAVNQEFPPSSVGITAWEVVEIKLGAPVRSIADADFETDILRSTPRYHDILINIGMDGTRGGHAALTAADVAIIPLQGYMLAANVRNRLIDRINTVRCDNPALGVVVIVPDVSNEAPLNCELARSVAARLRPSKIVIEHRLGMMDRTESHPANLPSRWPVTAYEYSDCLTTDLYRIVFKDLMKSAVQ